MPRVFRTFDPGQRSVLAAGVIVTFDKDGIALVDVGLPAVAEELLLHRSIREVTEAPKPEVVAHEHASECVDDEAAPQEPAHEAAPEPAPEPEPQPAPKKRGK